jgi:TonB family protein
VALSELTYEVRRPLRWDTFLAGLVLNCGVVLLVIVLGRHMLTTLPRQSIARSNYVPLVAPVMQKEQLTAHTLPPPVHMAKLQAPLVSPPVARENPPEPPKIEPPKVAPAKSEFPEVIASGPPLPLKPAPQVKTNVFASAKSEVATVHKPASAVQTGGFGDPNGIRGQGDPERNTIAAVAVGSFESPAGPGQGNGSGGSHGVSGTVRSAGFGDGTASTVASARHGFGAVASSGFDTVVEPRAAEPKSVKKDSNLQPIEITYKPRPAYTPEALRQRVEGEVLLDVIFTASGSLRINRVVKGLGYGLDDMALAAAQHIRFRPARRDGQPYDCAALVRIVFELAK